MGIVSALKSALCHVEDETTIKRCVLTKKRKLNPSRNGTLSMAIWTSLWLSSRWDLTVEQKLNATQLCVCVHYGTNTVVKIITCLFHRIICFLIFLFAFFFFDNLQWRFGRTSIVDNYFYCGKGWYARQSIQSIKKKCFSLIGVERNVFSLNSGTARQRNRKRYYVGV